MVICLGIVLFKLVVYLGKVAVYFGVGMLITISVAIVAFMLIVCFGDCLSFNSVVSCLA